MIIIFSGINEWEGWTVSMIDDNGECRESAGCDYVLDLISELEVAPAFPVVKNHFLSASMTSPTKVSWSNLPESLEDLDVDIALGPHLEEKTCNQNQKGQHNLLEKKRVRFALNIIHTCYFEMMIMMMNSAHTCTPWADDAATSS